MAEGGRRESESRPMESKKRAFSWNCGSEEVGMRFLGGGVEGKGWILEGLRGWKVVVLEERMGNLVVVLRRRKEGKLWGLGRKLGLEGGGRSFLVVEAAVVAEVVGKLMVSCMVKWGGYYMARKWRESMGEMTFVF